MDRWRRTRNSGIALLVASLTLVAASHARDLWVHPRNEEFDPERHYMSADGEIFYKHENDVAEGIGIVVVEGGAHPVIQAQVGRDLRAFVETNGGALEPVVLLDSNEDDAVDRRLRGGMRDQGAYFDSPVLADTDLRHSLWQLGIVYRAGDDGEEEFDGRYLASVDSRTARIQFKRVEDLAQVGAGPLPTGLVILKHREGSPFDFSRFVEDPTLYIESFVRLTREEDEDDWTVGEDKGTLRTQFDRADLYLVRTEDDVSLAVVWGDVPFEEYLRDFLEVGPNADGCYSSLDSDLENHDGSRVQVPMRLLYCPEDSVILFDAPPGYQVRLSAMQGDDEFEYTEVGTSIMDNIRLYVQEVYPRHPSSRSTGTVTGNITAGFKDAGLDLKDAGQHLITGSYRTNIHNGQTSYRPSPITGVPLFLWSMARLKPVEGFRHLFTGISSGVQVGADVVSATTNAVLNPVVQGSVGMAFNPGAADTGLDWFGALPQALAKNLPMSERFRDAFNPVVAFWRNNRAFAPVGYTRTDTQLNIDRVMAIIDGVIIGAIVDDGSSSGGFRGGDGNGNGNGGNGGNGMMPPGMKPPGMKPPGFPGFKPHKFKFDFDDDFDDLFDDDDMVHGGFKLLRKFGGFDD